MPKVCHLQLISPGRLASAMEIEDNYNIDNTCNVKLGLNFEFGNKNSRVIYVSSLSKTQLPRSSMDFIVVNQNVIQLAQTIRSLTVQHPPSIAQVTTTTRLAYGHHDEHLKNSQ